MPFPIHHRTCMTSWKGVPSLNPVGGYPFSKSASSVDVAAQDRAVAYTTEQVPGSRSTSTGSNQDTLG
jgi:hypothetical protein